MLSKWYILQPVVFIGTLCNRSFVIHRNPFKLKKPDNEQCSTVYPFYFFFLIKSVNSSSQSFIKQENADHYDLPNNLPIVSLTGDIRSHSSCASTFISVTSSNSNTTSLKITPRPLEHEILTKIDPQSSSLHDRSLYYFDICNCLIECCHSSHTCENASEVVFSQNTCQLIQQV
ncbi:unnamed protein product [Rotaria socialis]|uniref:Uncharacterized protein n=1 Tax=Rotaria socialis TaxID=392032 RepID=A0A820A769_9BILA|nr:unnamed protein product [Rotaria socialis]CAF4185780.1 unnamed protein product [Rotaria socialis]CAF4799122.1 unnamed protein product [Rotaria socialis]